MLWVYNFSNLCGSESRIGNGEQNEVVFKKGCEVWIGLQQGCMLLKAWMDWAAIGMLLRHFVLANTLSVRRVLQKKTLIRSCSLVRRVSIRVFVEN